MFSQTFLRQLSDVTVNISDSTIDKTETFLQTWMRKTDYVRLLKNVKAL